MRGSEGVAARENRGVTDFAFFFWRKVRLQSTEVVLSWRVTQVMELGSSNSYLSELRSYINEFYFVPMTNAKAFRNIYCFP
jgi:hypothetical protein